MSQEVATCVECGQSLRWRDALHGTAGRCKPCTKKAEKDVLRGKFIPSRDYVASLKRREGGR